MSAPLAPSAVPHDLRGTLITIGDRSYVLLSFRATGPMPSSLTPSEREVAVLMLAGRSNANIGQLRKSSPRTVANQVASVFRKLGVRSRAELAARWSHVLAGEGG